MGLINLSVLSEAFDQLNDLRRIPLRPEEEDPKKVRTTGRPLTFGWHFLAENPCKDFLRDRSENRVGGWPTEDAICDGWKRWRRFGVTRWKVTSSHPQLHNGFIPSKAWSPAFLQHLTYFTPERGNCSFGKVDLWRTYQVTNTRA